MLIRNTSQPGIVIGVIVVTRCKYMIEAGKDSS